MRSPVLFLSTPSARRATELRLISGCRFLFLSTPSARRATKRVTQKGGDRRFLSTPSARRATSNCAAASEQSKFLSTPSARRATCSAVVSLPPKRISIHALREEGDQRGYTHPAHWSYFYPRPPRGGRPFQTSDQFQGRIFLSTPSARRATSDPSSSMS